MKKGNVQTYQNRLGEDSKDPEFAMGVQEELQVLNLARKIAKLRGKQG